MPWYEVSGPCQPLLAGIGWHPLRQSYFPMFCTECYTLVAVKSRWRDYDLYDRVVETSSSYNGYYFSGSPSNDGCELCGISWYMYSSLSGSVRWDSTNGVGLPRADGWTLDYSDTHIYGTAECSYRAEVADNQYIYDSVSRSVSSPGYAVYGASKTSLVKAFSSSIPSDPGYPGGIPVGNTSDEFVSIDYGYDAWGSYDHSTVYDRVYTYRVNKY